MSPLLFICLVLPFFLLWISVKRSHAKISKRLPSPPKLPIIGNLHQLGSHPHRSLQALAKKYGPIMHMRLGSVDTVVVCSSEMAKEVMKTHDHNFANRPEIEAAKQLVYGCKDIAFAPYGDYWRQVRKVCVLHLLSAKKVQSFKNIRVKEVGLVIDHVKDICGDGPVNVSKIIKAFTNDVISRASLGRKYYGEDMEFGKMIDENVVIFGAFNPKDFFPVVGGLVSKVIGAEARMKRNAARWDKFLSQVIHNHLHGREGLDSHGGEDLVDVLLSLQRDESIGYTLSLDSIKAILQDMYAAGTDTSYAVIVWTMALLVRNPSTMKRVQEEIRRCGKNKPCIEEEDIPQMHYMRAVIKEVMRLHAPVPLLLPRETIERITINGYEIPKKSRVIINAWAISRDPASWDDPLEFRPERFVNNPVDYRGCDFQFIPFGAGRRVCPGIQFGTSTLELALVNLLYRFDWGVPEGMKAQDLDISEEYGIVMHIKNDLMLVATPHSNTGNSIT